MNSPQAQSHIVATVLPGERERIVKFQNRFMFHSEVHAKQ